MCEFISWVEDNGKFYFITNNDLQTKEGRKLLKQYNNNIYHEDVKGHGFIREYWGLKGSGIEKECTSVDMKDYPAKIADQIKKGNIRFGINGGFLTQSALAEYEKIEQPAWAEYEKIEQPALAEYEKIEQPALAEYEKIEHESFWKLFKKKENRIECWR